MTDSNLLSTAHENLAKLRENIGHVVIGQKDTIDQLLICVAAGGHVLIEGVPGLAKTLLARALDSVHSRSHAQ